MLWALLTTATMNDAIALFSTAFLLLMLGAICYVLWDNSVKKLYELTKVRWACWECLHQWMDNVEYLLEEVVKDDDAANLKMFEEVRQSRAKFEESLTALDKHLREE
jgi:hypothetical protein